LEYVVPADVQQAWIVFASFRDKQWSFTDCVSFALMKRLGIPSAIALDEHFEQMPGISRVPL
jgi:predicted nucleic acid-binding protein